MMRPHVGRRRSGFLVALVALAASAGGALAEGEPEAKARLEFLQAAVASLDPETADPRSKAAFAVVPKPLLRYSDPTRGGVKAEDAVNVLIDAGVWRLGAEGRPAALVTLEIYKAADGSRLLSFEFLSLTETAFTLRHKTEAVRWDATGSGLSLKELPDAPRPAATPAGRLTQMRQFARRFAATERFNKETIECRLVAQPIDRYHSAAQKIDDGAIFAYANGTNPELGVVLESDGARWRYGVLRLGAAQSAVTLDGQQVAAYEAFNPRGRKDGPYNSGSHKIAAGE